MLVSCGALSWSTADECLTWRNELFQVSCRVLAGTHSSAISHVFFECELTELLLMLLVTLLFLTHLWRVLIVKVELTLRTQSILGRLRHARAVCLHYCLLWLPQHVVLRAWCCCSSLSRAWVASLCTRFIRIADLLQLVDVRLEVCIWANASPWAIAWIIRAVLDVGLSIGHAIWGTLPCLRSTIFHRNAYYFNYI